MRIGVDVGGTNTDAVLMHGTKVLSSVKTNTTHDVTTGIVQAIREILRQGKVKAQAVEAVMIGTTHFTNAFVERKKLLEVGVIRIGAPATLSLPPFSGWPDEVSSVLGNHVYIVPGGYNFDGREIVPFDEEVTTEAIHEIRRQGLRTVAISCVFSPVNDAMESRAAALVKEIMPDARITLSGDIGRIGFLERENAAIMNASLRDMSRHVTQSFHQALIELNIDAPFYISQNDGTLMAAETAEKFPVLTIASGPTNSMRGAAFLTGQQDAIIVDIGGTTSDIGMVAQGFPRESSVSVNIGGVRTNFRMPDVLAIGLGGGSLVRRNDMQSSEYPSLGGKVSLGPDSVGYELQKKALVFGGDTLTLTDIAVAAGQMQVGDVKKISHLAAEFITDVIDEIHLRLEDAIDRMKTSTDPVTVILVGGGAALVSRQIKGAKEIIIPDHAGVANAIGAAIAQVGGEVDRVFSYDAISRKEAIAAASTEACDRAREAGAVDNIRVLDIEEIPIAYLPGGAVRLRIKAVGNLETASALSNLKSGDT